jgi:cystathionine beta-lyase
MDDKTKLIHKGRKPEKHFGTVNPPIYQSSTIIFPDLESYENAERGKPFYEPLFDSFSTDPAYGISGNQTNYALQETLKTLENGEECFITGSGLSAINTVLMSLTKADDHILVADNVYGPTRRFCNKVLKKFGVEVEYYDPEIGG